MTEKSLTELFDREAIRDCMMRYCHGIDRRDAGILKSVYWPEAIDDHGSFTGSAYEFVDRVLKRVGSYRQSSHSITNMIIRIDGNLARMQSYFTAYRCRPHNGALVDELFGGRYLDRMEKRSGEWRVLHRKVLFDWFREAKPAAADWEQGFMGCADRIGTSAPQDEASQLFEDSLLFGLKQQS